MSDSLPPSTGEETYQPISGFALAGLFVSAGFALLVLLSAGIAIVLGAPVFYSRWLLLMPIAGFVLSLVGRNQILGSDGTRAGLRLAHWGIGIALFSGLGYAAYDFAVGMAVTSQANNFLVGEPDADGGFFKHLTRGGQTPIDLDIAFLLTKPAAGRIKLRQGDSETLRATYDQPANDAAAGELSRFRSMALVRMLARAGDRAVVTPLGVQSWSHEKASYKVARNYEISTPEGKFEMLVQVESTEGEAEGQLRQWFVKLDRGQLVNRTLTPMGQAVEALRNEASRFVDGELRVRINQGKAFVDAAKADLTNWSALVPDTADHLRNGKNVYRGTWKEQSRALFGPGSGLMYQVIGDSVSWPMWGLDDQGRLWMDVPIRFAMPGDREAMPAMAEGRVRVRTRTPIDPATAPSPLPPLEWDAENFTVDRARPMRPGA